MLFVLHLKSVKSEIVVCMTSELRCHLVDQGECGGHVEGWFREYFVGPPQATAEALHRYTPSLA